EQEAKGKGVCFSCSFPTARTSSSGVLFPTGANWFL
ncbi:hypothetical protein TGARI_238260B, partial [Toxoplasma gondii ARI]